MLKYFSDKDSGQSVAINQASVKYVRDTSVGPKIVFTDGSYIVVTEEYMEVVSRLSERNK